MVAAQTCALPSRTLLPLLLSKEVCGDGGCGSGGGDQGTAGFDSLTGLRCVGAVSVLLGQGLGVLL